MLDGAQDHFSQALVPEHAFPGQICGDFHTVQLRGMRRAETVEEVVCHPAFSRAQDECGSSDKPVHELFSILGVDAEGPERVV